MIKSMSLLLRAAAIPLCLISIADGRAEGGVQSNVPTGGRPTSFTVDPSGRFAYVANIKSNNISAYAVDAARGVLRPVAGSPFRAGTHPYSVTIHPSGALAFVANQHSNDISVYRIDAAT